MELLATAVFAILLTLLCALFVFYGVYRKQVIGDLKADALVMKNLHIFDNISDLHPDAYDLNPDTLRITVVNANGSVIFDSNADFSVMDPAGQRTDLKDREGGRQYFCPDPEHDDDGSGSICPSLFLLYHDGKLFYEEPCGTDRADGGKSFGAGDAGGLQGAGTVYE